MTANPGTREYFRARRRAAGGGWLSLGQNVPISLVGAILGFFLFDRPSAVSHALSVLASGLVAPVIWQCLRWLYRFVWGAPEQVYVETSKELTATRQRLQTVENELARTSARLARILPQLRFPRLSPEQKLRFQGYLQGVEPQPVLVSYLDTPGADAYASDLVDTFVSAHWDAGKRGEKEGDAQGIMMRILAEKHIRPAQQAVFYALVSIGAQVGLMPGHNVAERVELIVGELNPECIVPPSSGEIAQPIDLNNPGT